MIIEMSVITPPLGRDAPKHEAPRRTGNKHLCVCQWMSHKESHWRLLQISCYWRSWKITKERIVLPFLKRKALLSLRDSSSVCCLPDVPANSLGFGLTYHQMHVRSTGDLRLIDSCLVSLFGCFCPWCFRQGRPIVTGLFQNSSFKSFVLECRSISDCIPNVAVFSCSVCVRLSYDPPVPVLIGHKSKYGHCSTLVGA